MEAVSGIEKQEETVVEPVGGDSAKQISRILKDFISTGAALTHRKTHILSFASRTGRGDGGRSKNHGCYRDGPAFAFGRRRGN